MKYFVVLIDYGRDVRKAHGLEAVVRPEDTRRQVVEQVRDVLTSDDLSLVHVKFIDGNFCEDVTDDILAEANADDPALSPLSRQEAGFNHARDERKHEGAL